MDDGFGSTLTIAPVPIPAAQASSAQSAAFLRRAGPPPHPLHATGVDESPATPTPTVPGPAPAAVAASLTPTPRSPPPPPLPSKPPPAHRGDEGDAHVDEEATKRKTIAERMAKLGGIKFGGAPPLPGMGRPPPQPPLQRKQASESEQGQGAEASVDSLAGTNSTPAPASAPLEETHHTTAMGDEETEEDERARRERIAAKLAGMGGMRIGMGMAPMGGMLPKKSHILKDEPVEATPPPLPSSPPPPTRGLARPPVPGARPTPPARPPPPPAPPAVAMQEPDSEHESHTSDDAIKVEASEGESEMEEVSYSDARGDLESEAEEVPPPPPPRRREPSGSSMHADTHSRGPPPAPYARPPVPMARPPPVPAGFQRRKSSTGTVGQPQRKPPLPTPAHQSDYVFVDEPTRPDETTEVPPPPPPRPAHRPPPSRSVPPPPVDDLSASISSQWELTSSHFGTTPDLSLSWSEASAASPDLSMSTASMVIPSSGAPPAGAGTGAAPSYLPAPPLSASAQYANLPPPPPPVAPSAFPASPGLPRTPTSAGSGTSAPRPPPKPLSVDELHLTSDDLMAVWGRVGVQVCEVATSFHDRAVAAAHSSSKKGGHGASSAPGAGVVGDGTYAGFVDAVLQQVPNAATHWTPPDSYGFLVYQQTAQAVQKRVSEILPGDIVEIIEARLKGHKGLQAYTQQVEELVGVVSEFEPKRSKIRVFQANLRPGQSVSV